MLNPVEVSVNDRVVANSVREVSCHVTVTTKQNLIYKSSSETANCMT